MSLHQKLQELEQQKKSIEREILQLRQEIEKSSPFSKTQKIQLFRSLFIVREDVYATHWVSKDGTKSGYAPATRTFRGSDYLPVTDTVIREHLEGKIRMGSYAVVYGVMTKFLVIDLDKSGFVEDARVIVDVAKDLGLSPLVEISKSGKGIHLWFFFTTEVRAVDARRLGDLLITKAMDSSSSIDMSSYDRLFPTQDFVAPDALGNLVALPLHFGSRQEDRTVFVEPETMQVLPDQWEVLKCVVKIEPSRLSLLLKAHFVPDPSTETLMPWEVKRDEPILFPKGVKAVLYEALYIEKTMLSKALLNEIKRFASFVNPEFYIRQSLRKSTYNVPRVISSFSHNERYLIVPRGLVDKFKRYFRDNQSRLTMEDKRIVSGIDKPIFGITLRKTQQEALKKILAQEYAIMIAPPGFGKTTVAAAVIAKRAVTTLILVHKTSLLEQWVERLVSYYGMDKKEIGQLGKGKKRITDRIDIATIQSLRNRPEMIEGYTQVIIDEVHHIPAVSFEIPLKRFRGKYVLGLSATPKRKDGLQPIMFMQCGEIAYEKKSTSKQIHQLITIETEYETFQESFALILNELVEDDQRNALIIEQIMKFSGRHILVLSERVEHLNILYHLLESKKVEACLLHGGLSQKMQKEALQRAKSASLILSTSSYMGEGLDFSQLDTIVFTMPISYEGRMVQYLGRIGRNKQECMATDFVDAQVAMLKSSFSKRMKAYKKAGYREVRKGGLFRL
jgi:superfamily II DNA or RNA helicase